MEVGRLRDPREVEVASVAVQVVDLLRRDMEDVFLDLFERSSDDPTGHYRSRAPTANRIVCLCRRLIDEVRRYERLRLCELDPETEERDIEF